MNIFKHLINFAADQSTQITISKGDVGLNDAPTNIGPSEVTMILNAVYVLAGIVAVIAIVIGGIRYTTSNGDANQIQSAKNTIQYAVIGLIVVILAAAITAFVGSNIGK